MRDAEENDEIARLLEQRKELRRELKRIAESRKIARDYCLLKSLQVLNFRFNRVTGELEGVEMRVRGARRKRNKRKQPS